MTEHQLLGFMAFAQAILVIYGIIEIRRATGLFKAGIELVVQAMGDISRQVAASSKELAELVRMEGEKIREALKGSTSRSKTDRIGVVHQRFSVWHEQAEFNFQDQGKMSPTATVLPPGRESTSPARV